MSNLRTLTRNTQPTHLTLGLGWGVVWIQLSLETPCSPSQTFLPYISYLYMPSSMTSSVRPPDEGLHVTIRRQEGTYFLLFFHFSFQLLRLFLFYSFSPLFNSVILFHLLTNHFPLLTAYDMDSLCPFPKLDFLSQHTPHFLLQYGY